MRIAYLPDYLLTGQQGSLRLLRSAATFRRLPGSAIYWVVSLRRAGQQGVGLTANRVLVADYTTCPTKAGDGFARLPQVQVLSHQVPDAGRAIHPAGSGMKMSSAAQSWNDALERQQSIYEELLASPEWRLEKQAPNWEPRPGKLSAREATRYLAGWTSPQAGAARAGW